MTNKAYIVANEEQEMTVLNDLERQGIKWVSGGEKPTGFTPKPIQFPYGLFTDDEGHLQWGNMRSLEDEEIVYDGRKEEQMSEKYVVSQKFMNELEEWKDNRVVVNFVNGADISHLPLTVNDWWFGNLPAKEYNNRLIAIIRWLNGEDVFEVEKWVVRSKDRTEQGSYLYVMLDISHGVKKTINFWDKDVATCFDTKEEAESWANSHQEVIGVKE